MQRLNVSMGERQNIGATQLAMMKTTTVRATICFDRDVLETLRRKAADTQHSISAIVSDVVREMFREDEEDLATIAERANEPSLSYEDFLKQLKADGTL